MLPVVEQSTRDVMRCELGPKAKVQANCRKCAKGLNRAFETIEWGLENAEERCGEGILEDPDIRKDCSEQCAGLSWCRVGFAVAHTRNGFNKDARSATGYRDLKCWLLCWGPSVDWILC